MSVYTFNGNISKNTEEVVAAYKEACDLRGKTENFLRRGDNDPVVQHLASEVEDRIVELQATIESLLGECIRADMP